MQMAYNFTNPYNFPWPSGFTPNPFSGPHPASTPRPGFPSDLYPSGRFPGMFPFGMPYQGGEHSSQFRGADWTFPYHNNMSPYGPMQQNNTGNCAVQGGNINNFNQIAGEMQPLNLPQNGNATAPNAGNCEAKQILPASPSQLNPPLASDHRQSDSPEDAKSLETDIVNKVSSLLSDSSILQNAVLYSKMNGKSSMEKA